MRLQSLELENFRQYAHAQVQFETGITAIVGVNGAGKSTLVEAILWALYGARVAREGAKTLRFLWSQGGAKVQVKLVFALGERLYRVVRTPSDAALAQMRDGTWIPIARGTAPVNQAVQQLLGMDERQFQTSFCARQKELEFMGYQPQRRREEISKMLGYERVSKAVDNLTNATRQLNARVEGLKQGIGDPQLFEQQIADTETILRQLHNAKADLEHQLSNAQATLERAKEECAQQEQKRRKYEELQSQKQILEARLQEIERRLQEQRQQWEEVQIARKRYQEIKEEVAQYRTLHQQLRELDQLAQSEQERTRLNTQLEHANQQAEQVAQKLDTLKQKRAEYEALRPQMERAEWLDRALAHLRQAGQLAGQRAQLVERYENLQQQIQALDAVAEQLAQTEQQLADRQRALATHEQKVAECNQRLRDAHEAWTQQRSSAQATVQSLQREYRQLKERHEQLQSLGAEGICPTCGQPLGESYQQVLEELAQNLRSLQQQIRDARKQAEALEQEPASLIALRTELERLQTEGDRLRAEEARLRQQMSHLQSQLSQCESLHKQAEQIERQIATLPEYDPEQERTLQAERDMLEMPLQQARTLEIELREEPSLTAELGNIQREIRQLQARLNQLPQGYDPNQHAQVRQAVETLAPLYEEYVQLKPVLEKKESLRAQIESTRAEQEARQNEREQTETSIAQLGYDEQAYQQALIANQTAEAQLKETEARYRGIHAEISAKNELLQTLQANLSQIRARQQELEEA
ncbi:MAG: SMC family ATPase, partial [Fimbriimonadales bacterium]